MFIQMTSIGIRTKVLWECGLSPGTRKQSRSESDCGEGMSSVGESEKLYIGIRNV